MKRILLLAAVITLAAGCTFLLREPDEREKPLVPPEEAPAPRMEEKAEVENVIIRNHEFNPGIKRIAEGDQVSWINMDAARHTVTFEKNEGLGSPALKRGQTYWRKFDETGVFNYYCSFHPAMRGIIIVEEQE